MPDRVAAAPEPRDYRRDMAARGLVRTDVAQAESDLTIFARRDVRAEATALLAACRHDLAGYIPRDPQFLRALRPVLPLPHAPAIAQRMIAASAIAGVGPMAAVAGAIAEDVCRGLLSLSDEVIVENGGDIYLYPRRARLVSVWARGSGPIPRLALEVRPEDGPLAICTSSGKFGHSLSFGRADAATAVAADGSLADAAATALGNLVQTASDIETALAFARRLPGLRAAVIIIDGQLGAWGSLRLVDLGGAPAGPELEGCRI